ncbi:MAG: hypothetical protein CVU00_14295 [Bacteroidetes bacterium HGW-Bacteroidetes-17]|jgi:hypothetical protein|nr:MAG: hypothetical protein CVU00_14295 [Bacteroidetes bacterium HGW-Bacteroidetes-17]
MYENKDIQVKKRKRSWYRYFLYFLLLILVFFSITEVITLIFQKKAISLQYGQGEQSRKIERALYSQETIELLRKKSYLSGRIDMAKSDSITLVVSLVDSVIRLELKGVIIHRAPILKYSKNRLFESSDQFAISNLLSVPGKVTSFEGTLPKEPMMIKIAPKDTSDAIPDIAPDTSKVEPVYYRLNLDNGIIINISEDNPKSYIANMPGFIFNTNEKISQIWDNASSLLRGKRPKNILYIRLKVDARDGRIIYRALPYKARVTVRM